MITKYEFDIDTAMKNFDLPFEYKKQVEKRLRGFKMASTTSKAIAKAVKKVEELSLDEDARIE